MSLFFFDIVITDFISGQNFKTKYTLQFLQEKIWLNHKKVFDSNPGKTTGATFPATGFEPVSMARATYILETTGPLSRAQ